MISIELDNFIYEYTVGISIYNLRKRCMHNIFIQIYMTDGSTSIAMSVLEACVLARLLGRGNRALLEQVAFVSENDNFPGNMNSLLRNLSDSLLKKLCGTRSSLLQDSLCLFPYLKESVLPLFICKRGESMAVAPLPLYYLP